MNIQNNYFSSLPREIQMKVFSKISKKDLVSCMCVSKEFQSISFGAHKEIASKMGIKYENNVSISDLRKRITGMVHLPDWIKDKMEKFNLKFFNDGSIKYSIFFVSDEESFEADCNIDLSLVKHKEKNSAQFTVLVKTLQILKNLQIKDPGENPSFVQLIFRDQKLVAEGYQESKPLKELEEPQSIDPDDERRVQLDFFFPKDKELRHRSN